MASWTYGGDFDVFVSRPLEFRYWYACLLYSPLQAAEGWESVSYFCLQSHFSSG